MRRSWNNWWTPVEPGRCRERRTFVSTSEHAIGSWLKELGSAAATPGGGAAAGVAAATGAALIAMVGRLTVGKEGFEDLDARMRSLVEAADAERDAFLALADEDAEAFDSVMASFRLPKETDEEKALRTMRIQEAYEAAAAVPLRLATRCVRLMELAEDAAAMGNPHAASDGYSAGMLLFAAALAAMANVRINAAGLRDEAKGQMLVDECDALRARADTLLQQVEEAFLLRLSP
jgi:formiminotetrahydrofolate cyclodeaminase